MELSRIFGRPDELEFTKILCLTVSLAISLTAPHIKGLARSPVGRKETGPQYAARSLLNQSLKRSSDYGRLYGDQPAIFGPIYYAVKISSS